MSENTSADVTAKIVTVEEINSNIDYLLGKINIGASFLDAKAISIMNELKNDIVLLGNQNSTVLQPSVEENYIVSYTIKQTVGTFKCGVVSDSEENAKNRFINLFPNNSQIDKVISAVKEIKTKELEDYVVEFKTENMTKSLHYVTSNVKDEVEAEKELIDKYVGKVVEIVGVTKFTEEYFKKLKQNTKIKQL